MKTQLPFKVYGVRQATNTFTPVHELMSRGINKDSVYREESVRKTNDYSTRKHLCEKQR
jgi:hypothetical protein